MSNVRRNFIPRNEGFTCELCHQTVPPATATFRNHCPHCLVGKHVDQNLPGDRASTCGGLMPTIRYEGTNPSKLKFIQQCTICQKIHRNKAATDDNLEIVYRLTGQQYRQ